MKENKVLKCPHCVKSSRLFSKEGLKSHIKDKHSSKMIHSIKKKEKRT